MNEVISLGTPYYGNVAQRCEERGRFSVGFFMDFDVSNNILRVTLEGQLTDAILLEAYATAARYVTAHAPCYGIFDASGVTKFEVSSNAVRELARSSPIIPAGY